MPERFERLPLRAIDPNPWQPRERYEKDELRGLAESIKELGVIQPVVVRPHPSKKDHYQLAVGGRRKLASEIADQQTFPLCART